MDAHGQPQKSLAALMVATQQDSDYLTVLGEKRLLAKAVRQPALGVPCQALIKQQSCGIDGQTACLQSGQEWKHEPRKKKQ